MTPAGIHQDLMMAPILPTIPMESSQVKDAFKTAPNIVNMVAAPPSKSHQAKQVLLSK